MDNKKEFFYLVIIGVLAFFLLRSCNTKETPIKNGSEIIISTDTIKTIIKGAPDTVFLEVEKIVYKDKKPTKIAEEIDTTPEGTIDTVKTYLTEFSDSLIDATIKSKVKGSLLSTELNFKPKFPRYITRTDTIKEKIETIKARNNYELSVGAVLGGSSDRFSFAPSLMLKTKKPFYLSLGYDLIIKTYNVGFYVPIRWNR
tara:strand:+ start:9126 stop:9725 length:600 start_codon:yes stop_codon:yes gene_type:complete